MYAFLTIDHGNTSTKASLWIDGKVVDSVTCRADMLLAISRLIGSTGREIVGILCSVRTIDPETLDLLRRMCPRLTILDSTTPLPITIGYSTPRTLGADRIAAAVGAYVLYGGKQLLVADLGTAATFDSVTADGCYQGGNIAPGAGMRLRALHEFTSRLPLLDIDSSQRRMIGNDTHTALEAGVVYGLVAELTYYATRLPQPCVTVVTGGDAHLIAERCDFPIMVEDHLVQKGLHYIIQHIQSLPD